MTIPRRPGRLRAALLAGELARTASRMSRRPGDGVHARGRVIMAVDPGAIQRLARARESVLVTGTNGKTTTTYLLARALGEDVAHNYTGANMQSGVVTAYADTTAPRAAIEVDELHLASIAPMVVPRAIVLLNLSRDQLDRSHEVAHTVASWAEAVSATEAVVVANCADPNVVAATPAHRAIWFDPGTRWIEDAQICPRCGELIDWTASTWSCACGFAMPKPHFQRAGSAVIGPDAEQHDLRLRIPGDFNLGNAVAAVAAAHAMGVDAGTALDRMSTLESAFGRYLRFDIGGRPTRLLLAKNPAGMHAALGLVGDDPLIVGISAEAVDGRDTSWLYDVPFEMLAGRQVGATGQRRDDLALRLSIAGVHPLLDVDVHRLARRMPGGNLTLIGNYSNFIIWRRERAWRA